MGTLTFGQSKNSIRSSVALDNRKEILAMPNEIKIAPQALKQLEVEKIVYVDRDVIREVIKEVKVEVPVNVYKDKIVEVIKEVPVEVIKIQEKMIEVVKEVPTALCGAQFFYYTAPLFILGVAIGFALGYLL